MQFVKHQSPVRIGSRWLKIANITIELMRQAQIAWYRTTHIDLYAHRNHDQVEYYLNYLYVDEDDLETPGSFHFRTTDDIPVVQLGWSALQPTLRSAIEWLTNTLSLASAMPWLDDDAQAIVLSYGRKIPYADIRGKAYFGSFRSLNE